MYSRLAPLVRGTMRAVIRASQFRTFSIALADGWLSRVKSGGSLVGPLDPSPTRFDAAFSNLTVTATHPGIVHATLPVTESLANSYGTLHGGATASLIDIVGTLACLSVDPTRPGVSVHMTQAYLKSSRIGETLFLTGRCLKNGKTLAFTEVEIRSGSLTGPLIATGTHTKAL
jgi:acyl-coenzyme A thioesterase 13